MREILTLMTLTRLAEEMVVCIDSQACKFLQRSVGIPRCQYSEGCERINEGGNTQQTREADAFFSTCSRTRKATQFSSL